MEILEQATLAIDPGVQGCGWAEFTGPTLMSCGYLRSTGETMAERAMSYAKYFQSESFNHVVVERMRHYPNAQERDAKANDLLDLQLLGGYIAGSLRCNFFSVFASEWKGQVPKDVMNARVMKRLRDLERVRFNHDVEKIRPSLRHNVIDAIGIGLWYLGRR